MTASADLKFESVGGACLLCGGRTRRKLFTVSAAVLQECEACSFRYFDPCLSSESMGHIYESSEHLGERDSVHGGYYEYGDLEKPTKTLRDFERGLKLLENGLGHPAKPSLFEIGFGSGLFLALAQKRGWAVDGLETSATNVELAKKKFGLSVRTGDLFREPQTGAFDAAAAWDVLEHQSRPQDFLKQLRGLLKPGGMLLIAVPNDYSFLRLLSAFLYRLSFGKVTQGMRRVYVLEHIGYYSPKTLRRMLETCGFKVEGGFLSSTDLDRYRFSPLEKLSAWLVLAAGKLLGLQNRLILVARKSL